MCKLIILSLVVLNSLKFAQLFGGGVHIFRLYATVQK